MNDKPLENDQFEACKLIVNTKHPDHRLFASMAKWSYSDYLLSRWKMKTREKAGGLLLVCSIDFNHKVVSVSDECVVETDADNGKEEATDCYGNEEYHCRHNEADPVLDESYLEEFEDLCTSTSPS